MYSLYYETSFAFSVSCFVLTKEAMALHYLVTFVTFYKIVENKMCGSIVKDLNPGVKRVDLIRRQLEGNSVSSNLFLVLPVPVCNSVRRSSNC